MVYEKAVITKKLYSSCALLCYGLPIMCIAPNAALYFLNTMQLATDNRACEHTKC